MSLANAYNLVMSKFSRLGERVKILEYDRLVQTESIHFAEEKSKFM